MTIGDIGPFLAEGEHSLGRPPWGMELVLDLVGCDPDTIASSAALHLFDERLMPVLDMQPYGPLILHRFALDNPRAAGYTFVRLITTSAVTIHFGELENTAYVNVFSCKPFDPDKVTAFIRDFFGAILTNTEVRYRG